VHINTIILAGDEYLAWRLCKNTSPANYRLGFTVAFYHSAAFAVVMPWGWGGVCKREYPRESYFRRAWKCGDSVRRLYGSRRPRVAARVPRRATEGVK